MAKITINANDLSTIQTYNNQKEGDKQLELFNYYSNEDNIPVKLRQAVSEAKKASHTNLHINFFSDIVELKVGYVGQGISPTVNIDDEDPLKGELELQLKSFNRVNALDTLNSESVRMSTISGKSHRLCYTKDGIFYIKNIPAWSVVYDYDDSPLNPNLAYYYFEEIDLMGKTVKYCHVYDDTHVHYFKAQDTTSTPNQASKGNNDTATYVAYSPNNKGEAQPHNFKEVPIIPIYNNDVGESDCVDSTPIMDVYDEIISDTSGEVKAMRLAYLILYGNLYTGKDKDGNPIDINTWMKQTSTMRFPASEDGKKVGGAEFLEKNINDTVIENLLNRLRTHIFEISGSLDLKELASTERVFSIKAQMMRLENTAKSSELYMRAALYKQTRLWVYIVSAISGKAIDELMIDWEFSRTFPRDLQAEAETIDKLTKSISVADALKAVGWENAQEIADRADEVTQDLKNLEGEDIIIDEDKKDGE